MTATVAPVDQALTDEAVRHLRALIRLDTTNPPGAEDAAARYIADTCREAGIEAEVVGGAPGRGNVAARLRAASPLARPLMLTGHTDVVSVEHDRWTVDPFGGELRDGYVWGRGALDMKSQVAAELAVLLRLKRDGVALDRDITLVAFADEEAGGEWGASWVWNHRRDLLDAEYAINEGGGEAIRLGGQTFYLCQAGEKGTARLRLTARAAPGHASIPRDDTAMRRLGEALVRLHGWEPPTILTGPVRQLLATVGPSLDGDGPVAVERILAEPSPRWADIAALGFDDDTRSLLRATTRNTAVPTIVHGGHRINVIPSEVVLDVDGRILPGEDPDVWRDQVQAVVGDGIEVELLSRDAGIAADPASPLFDAIAATIDALDPGARVAPYLVSGGTDAANLPGIKVYGFFPFPPSERVGEYTPLVHGHDERIAVADLAFATRFLHDLVRRFCGA
ncbi:MAG: peptidase M20 [uncultured Thermomicrobiales bacterium]|uniref:Peptidase M20 n=1 Tax=uncultured Thermomicrobiales bacterium TaxID=1645740 RepID=A0A6J4UVJ8_9BACT|nr:MAG: peptidase M20 [uncultured Thermomicrobiales bacterium]